MSDFWDTYETLHQLEAQGMDNISAWDDTPSITRDAMTSADWSASADISEDKSQRHGWLAENLGSWVR